MTGVSLDRLREVLAYEPVTGVFTWLVNMGPRAPAGRVAGGKLNGGYLTIRIDGKNYPAHRLAWRYVHGDLEQPYIDHINGKRDDNRIANLRPATKQINAHNQGMRSDNRSGLRGVVKHKNRWRAQITINRVCSYLGLYETPEAASAAYLAARAVHFPTQPTPREFL